MDPIDELSISLVRDEVKVHLISNLIECHVESGDAIQIYISMCASTHYYACIIRLEDHCFSTRVCSPDWNDIDKHGVVLLVLLSHGKDKDD